MTFFEKMAQPNKSDNTVICDSCGKEYKVGQWPFCPHGEVVPENSGHDIYYSDNIAPPPGPNFQPPKGINYCPDRGYEIRSRGDKLALMRRNRVDYPGSKHGPREF
jgi:hypothetical protein